MITNFEKQTKKISAEEIEVGRLIVSYLKKHYNSPEKTIKSYDLVKSYNKLGFNLKDSTIRRIVNYFRAVECVPILASGKGYFYCTDKDQIQLQIQSLKDRESAIRFARKGLESYLK